MCLATPDTGGREHVKPVTGYIHIDLNIQSGQRTVFQKRIQLGKTIITLQKEGRESHLTPDDARRRAERTVNELIEKEINARLNNLLDTLSGQ